MTADHQMDDLMQMAREAGFHSPVPADGYMGLAYDRREGRETGGSLERFAQLVAKKAVEAEREACAELVEQANSILSPEIAAAIRARR